ncbi:MAG: hypothetical protein ACXVA9_02930 [Bdellovibrionales bacterium]
MIIHFLFAATSALFAKEAVHVKPLNLKPVVGQQTTKEPSQSIRTLEQISMSCIVGQEKYALHGKDDEQKCRERGGRVQSTSEDSGKLIDIKVAPTPVQNSHLQKFNDPSAQKIQGNIHQDPLDNH